MVRQAIGNFIPTFHDADFYIPAASTIVRDCVAACCLRLQCQRDERECACASGGTSGQRWPGKHWGNAEA
jgi:hypothetical protein